MYEVSSVSAGEMMEAIRSCLYEVKPQIPNGNWCIYLTKDLYDVLKLSNAVNTGIVAVSECETLYGCPVYLNLQEKGFKFWISTEHWLAD